MIRRSVTVPTVSAADDLAFSSLADIVSVTTDLEVRIVGGHMAGLLLTAFPTGGLEARRTNDADAGISVEVAAAGMIHDRLLNLNYEPVNGNRLVKDGRAIDLLIPDASGQFHPEVHGGRGFDATPGLLLALSGDPILIDLTVIYRDGAEASFTVPVPSVESAVILKAYAASSRTAPKDVTDLFHLLSIRDAQADEAIGGWRMDEDELIGARKDAAQRLHQLATGARLDPRFAKAEVSASKFAALVRGYVSRS
jgi:hypothetical protein